MNVKQLKEQLAGIPDEAIVVVSGPDYCYRPALVDSTRTLPRSVALFWGELNDQEDGHPVEVAILLFS